MASNGPSPPSGPSGGGTIGEDERQALNYKKIFIQRDYSKGTGVRFQAKYPQELNGLIREEDFIHLIESINQIYDDSEHMSGRAFCESCCACLSAYLIYLCMDGLYEKNMRKISDFIDEQNNKIWKPRGVMVRDPMERGLRVIEITIKTNRIVQQQQPSTDPIR